MEYAKTVDGYIEKQEKWKNQLIHLRKLLAGTALKEEIKWGAPTYTLNGKLIAGMAAFKNHYEIQRSGDGAQRTGCESSDQGQR